jgi:hypothetical protein
MKASSNSGRVDSERGGRPGKSPKQTHLNGPMEAPNDSLRGHNSLGERLILMHVADIPDEGDGK